ncbi:MAG: hypothetical protein IBX41_08745 [Methanophagales archaeon]|nr:hypothetical protein [Methanophagales archaeon]
MELWQILLGIAFLLIVLTFAYLLISWMRRGRKDKKAEIIKIIKEMRELKEKIEKEEGGLTSITDVYLVSVQILSEIRGINAGMNDVKALILFCVGVLVALNLTIISML